MGHKVRFEKQTDNNKDKYVSRGVYKLICPHCGKVCIETSVSLTQELKAHHLSFINNHTTAKFAQHLLEYCQSFGKMENVYVRHFNKRCTHVVHDLRCFYSSCVLLLLPYQLSNITLLLPS
jgi:hypothetical protein